VLWCRDGKEKSVGDGFVSSPITVRNPAKLNSSGSLAFWGSSDNIPTSKREEPGGLERFRAWVVDGKKVVIVRAWERVS